MNRGDIITSAASGDYGKPRPALVVQSDLFNATHSSIVICPITSHLVETPLFRIAMKPSRENGLKKDSQVMVDKISAVKRERIGRRIGTASATQMAELDQALSRWLGLENGD